MKQIISFLLQQLSDLIHLLFRINPLTIDIIFEQISPGTNIIKSLLIVKCNKAIILIM